MSVFVLRRCPTCRALGWVEDPPNNAQVT
jgi:hypothetical protein